MELWAMASPLRCLGLAVWAVLTPILPVTLPADAAHDPQKRVPVLHSAPSDLDADGIVDRTLRTTLEAEFGDRIDYATEFTTVRLQQSAWETYRWQILGVVLLLVMKTALIAGLLIQRARRARAEIERQQKTMELAHLNRVATIGELSGALAHELNQPLTAILSNAQAAQRTLGAPPIDVDELQAALTDIVDANKHAADVIAHMRTMMKKEDAQPQPLNLNEVAKDALHFAHAELMSRRVSVAVRWASDLPAVLGDPVQLQQVVLNLTLNACDAMNGNPLGDRGLTITTTADGPSQVRLMVADRGVGIPPENINRVFEPFFTSKQQGLGLGLTICRSIVAAHGGRLWVANNAEGGATFHTQLPVACLGAKRGTEMRPEGQPALVR